MNGTGEPACTEKRTAPQWHEPSSCIGNFRCTAGRAAGYLRRSDFPSPFSAGVTMPTIRVDLFAGRSVEQKRQLAAALTEAPVRPLGGSPESVDILFYDVERHDWATGGRLWVDRKPAKPIAD